MALYEKKYLQMNGTSDYLRTPTLTFDKIVIDFKPKRLTQATNYLQWLGGTGLSIARNPASNIDTWYGVATLYKNNVLQTKDTNIFIENERVTLDARSGFTNTIPINFFSNSSGTSNLKGDLYSIKIYNGATLVAFYDMSTGTVQDQSGNGNHATLTGGTWVTDPTKYVLNFNGINDYLQTPSLTYDTIILDFKPFFKTTGQQFYIDSRAGTGGHFLMHNANSNWDEFNGFNVTVSVNNVQKVAYNNFITNQTRQTIKYAVNKTNYPSGVTGTVNFFADTNNNNKSIGTVYSITLTNNGTTVAFYDMTTGTIQDQSGNGNNATLVGGRWDTQLFYADGIDDCITLPSLAFDKIVMDWAVDNTNLASSTYYVIDTGTAYSAYARANDDFASSATLSRSTGGVKSPTLKRYTLTASYASGLLAGNVLSFLGRIGGTQFTKGYVYNLKVYNGTTLVAEYDMSTGNANDVTGNGKNATLGGNPIFIEPDYSPPANTTGVTELTENTNAILNWTPPTDNDFSSVKIYQDAFSPYLNMDGSSMLTLPAMTANTFILDVYLDSVYDAYDSILDTRDTVGTGGYFNTNEIGGSYSTYKIDGVDASRTVNDTTLPKNKRIKIQVTTNVNSTGKIYVFGFNGANFLKGRIYSVTCKLDNTLVAYYDMSKYSTQDQSGNGKNPTITGNPTFIYPSTSTFLTEVSKGINTYTSTGITPQTTTYTYKITSVDVFGNESSGTYVATSPDTTAPAEVTALSLINANSSKTYLQLDGLITNESLVTPSIAYDKVVFDVNVNDKQQNLAYLLTEDAVLLRYQGGGSWFSTTDPNIKSLTGLATNARTTISLALNAVTTAKPVGLFQRGSGTSNSYAMKVLVYDVKFYNGTTLVAWYDMSTGSVLDQSGNGNHATLTGGTWVNPRVKYLAMNGQSDYITLPSMTMDSIELDVNIDSTQVSTNPYLLQRINGWSSQYLASAGSSGWTSLYVNGVLQSSATWANIPKGQSVTIKLVPTTSFTDGLAIFTANSLSQTSLYGTKGKINRITCYLNNAIVAQYDMSKGNVQDQSGNNRHATLVGGSWSWYLGSSFNAFLWTNNPTNLVTMQK
jgi:hypothetical protein